MRLTGHHVQAIELRAFISSHAAAAQIFIEACLLEPLADHVGRRLELLLLFCPTPSTKRGQLQSNHKSIASYWPVTDGGTLGIVPHLAGTWDSGGLARRRASFGRILGHRDLWMLKAILNEMICKSSPS